MLLLAPIMIHYITTTGVGNAWVGNELRVLEKEKIPFVLHSVRSPEKHFFASPEIDELNRNTNCLYPLALVSTLASLLLAPKLHGKKFFEALWNGLTGPRESRFIRLKGLWHLAVACHWARSLLNQEVSLIHSQWIHSCGSIGMYGAWLLDVPFSFTGHATDLFRDRALLEDKIRRADFIVCISTFHRDFYLENGARPEQLKIVYCGIDTSLFRPRDDRTERKGPFRILSSGRLVEKKGFRYLIDACQILSDRGVDVECTIAGSGELEQKLKSQIIDRNLQDRVFVTGQSLLQEKIPEFMHSGDVYCLPCVWASDNDVDGLPQMLMEAMACELPVISTRLVGIPDLIIDGLTGLLVGPNDAISLANAIERIFRDPDRARNLARTGREIVLDKFDLKTCLQPLLNEFRKRLKA